MKTPNYLHDLVARLAQINPTTAVLPQQKKMGEKDSLLGFLDEDLQRVWVLREAAREQCKELLDKIDDLAEVSKVECLQPGGALDASLEKFRMAIRPHAQELKPIGMEFRILDSIFQELLRQKFTSTDEKPILGIRDGFRVVCLEDNSRGDLDTPFTKLEKAHVTRIVIQAEMIADPSTPLFSNN